MRLGGVVATSGALQLLPQSADRALSWLRTMGRHSMLGYFVSIELPYGVLSRVFHKKLSTTAAVLGDVECVRSIGGDCARPSYLRCTNDNDAATNGTAGV